MSERTFGVPTEEHWPYDYGEEINKKLKDLNWDPAQYDYFLDFLTQELPIDNLVELVLKFAPVEWIESAAKEIGVFEIEEEEEEE